MNDAKEKLKLIIGELMSISVDNINRDLSLDLPRFKSSAGRLILSKAIESSLGITDIDTSNIKVYADLEALVFNDTSSSVENGGKALQQGSSIPIPSHPSGDTGSFQETIEEQDTQLSSTAPFQQLSATIAGMITCGIDIEPISTFPETDEYWTHEFYSEIFVPEEIAYCCVQSDPRMHFAARWCAKEALKKCSPIYMNLQYSQIRILSGPNGIPCLQVKMNGNWQDCPASLSLAHTPGTAVAIVISFAKTIT